MTKTPEPGSGAFDNAVVEQAWAEIEPVLMEIAKTRIRDNELAGFVKPTWKALKAQPEEEAVQTIARMIMQPWWRRQGLEMARKLFDEMEGTDGLLEA
jgi:ABC-type Fe3+-citrate transport system substrate-binding protein